MKTSWLSPITLITAIFLTSLAHAQGSAWNIDSAHSGTQFVIRHLGVSNVRGSITGVKGTVFYDEKDITHSNVTATMDTATVNTSSEGRDKDLKSPAFFDVAKYPTMTFRSTSIARVNGKLQMVGDLTLNGITKPITLDVEEPSPPQKGMGGKLVSGFSATGSLKRTDFNFGGKYSPPILGDEVKLTIDLEINRQP